MTEEREQLSLWARHAPGLTVFAANVAIMAIELTAGRLVSRYLGMSLYTWTALIGAIMAGMALGNLLGGRIADRRRPLHALAALFLLAAAGCVALLPGNALLGGLGLLEMLPWPVRIFLHIAALFTLPAILLGAIGPVVARYAIAAAPQSSGRIVGALFAWSVAGSILGTFLTGYVLVFVLGARAIFLAAAAALATLGAAYAFQARRTKELPPETPYAATLPLPAAKRFAPAAAVFASNLAFMIIEMAAARIVAREFGGSIYTWTTVIGIVLAGVSLGNWIGGQIADRKAGAGTLAALFLIGSITAAAAPWLSQAAGTFVRESPVLSTRALPLQIAVFLAIPFFLPCVLMGTVSPVAVKRALDNGWTAGGAVGAIYAWGSVGGIAGTFLAGYFLIAWIGSLPAIVLAAAIMAAAAAAHAKDGIAVPAWCAVCLAIMASPLTPGPLAKRFAEIAGVRLTADDSLIYQDESQYSFIAILADPANPNLRKMRLDALTHSIMDIAAPQTLKYEYEWVYDAVIDVYCPKDRPLRDMVIGGGGYAFPRYLEVTRPSDCIDVSEIDPAVTEAAHAALGLPRDTRMAIFNMDGRNHIEDVLREKRAGKTSAFDCVFGDSISDYSVPYHLTTVETVRNIHELLTDDGIYLLNMLDMYNSGAFVAAIVNTCRQVFPYVYVFNTGRPPTTRDAFVTICSKRALQPETIVARAAEKYPYLGREIAPAELEAFIARHGNVLLTDDYAPVENLLRPVLETRDRDAASLHLGCVRDLAADGRLEDAVAECDIALELRPGWDAAAKTRAELAKAIAQRDAAIVQARKALDAAPDSGIARYNLGVTLANARRFEEALAEWRIVLQNNPKHADALYNSLLALIYLKRYDDAWNTIAWMEQNALPVSPDILAKLEAIAPRK